MAGGGNTLKKALEERMTRVRVHKAGVAQASEVDAIRGALQASRASRKAAAVKSSAIDINAAGDSIRAAVAAMPTQPTRMPTRAEIVSVTQPNARAEESVVGVMRAQRLIRQGKL
jgi:hypothetical protein